MAAPLLEIRNVKKYYPVKKVRNGEDISVKAVDQIDLTVNQGEIVGLVGAVTIPFFRKANIQKKKN